LYRQIFAFKYIKIDSLYRIYTVGYSMFEKCRGNSRTTIWTSLAVLALGSAAVQAAPDKTTPVSVAAQGSAGFSHVKSLGGIDEYRLESNGLTVLLVPDHSAPVVTFEVTYQVGSRNEVTGTTGATHIL
jgi:hypothetical protein